MAKGGQGPASPGTPSFGQEIVGLKKTIEDKNKAMAELKAKLEANEKELEKTVSTQYLKCGLTFVLVFKLLHFGTILI